MKIDIKIIGTKHKDYSALLKLINEVLRKPFNLKKYVYYPTDEQSIHIAAYSKQQLVGCMVIKFLDNTTAQCLQLAVSTLVQGCGIGSLLVKFAENLAKENGLKSFILNSRLTSKTFYEKHGYICKGEEVLSDINIPVILMQKNI